MVVPGTALAAILLACPVLAQEPDALGQLRASGIASAELPSVGASVEVSAPPLPTTPGACRVSAMIPAGFGRWSAQDLRAAAKTVYGEASPDTDEQCGVALTIFNRAEEDEAPIKEVVAEPGQFEGYRRGDVRRDCDKLAGSVRAVLHVARGGRCRFGRPAFKYFCAYRALRRSRRPHAVKVGETAFFADGPC